MRSDFFRKTWNKFLELDWKNPKILVTAAAIFTLPIVGGYYVNSGIFVGTIMAAAALWLVDKLPSWTKQWCVNHPLAADLLISTIMVVMTGKLFASGLILGSGAIFCALILSVALPYVSVPKEPEAKTA